MRDRSAVILDALAADAKLDPKDGISLAKTGHKEALGKPVPGPHAVEVKLPVGPARRGKADNQILA